MLRHRYSPEQLLEKYRSIRNSSSTEQFMRSPKHNKTQEIWCATHFSKAFKYEFGPCWIHISDNDEQEPADFWFEFEEKQHPFQITMALDPKRRLGDEYRNFEENGHASVLEDPSRGTQFGASWISQRIEAKANQYGSEASSLNLLVYLNFTAHDQQYDTIRIASIQHAMKFNSVWLINGNAFCCIKQGDDLPSFELWRIATETLANTEI